MTRLVMSSTINPAISAKGEKWRVRELTEAQSRAYKRPGQRAPRFEAVGPAGSIVRALTEPQLRDKVRQIDWS